MSITETQSATEEYVPPTSMADLHATLKALYEDGIQDDWDRVILVIGGEGVGKSTLMQQLTTLHKDIKGDEVTPDTVLNRIVYGGRREFQELMTQSAPESIITVQDAARVFHNLEIQTGEQRELQKAMLDIRVKNCVFVFGFQDWDDIPRFLAKRRAKNALVIPRRGYVKGYNREQMDIKRETDEWPEPVFRNYFPSLEGFDVWSEFQNRDYDHKMERVEANDEMDPDDVHWNANCRVALRAVKPWSEEEGLTQKDTSKIIDFSDTWVSNRMEEWREGHHRDLFDESELDAIQNTTTVTADA
jgi:hypothetical protein